MFYTKTPEGLRTVDDVALQGGTLTIEDRSNNRRISLPASRPL
jgi:hypothetical protein